MLVTCFGYVGYRNAKFGQIRVQREDYGDLKRLLMQIEEKG
jgi:hypothetical protein